MLCLVLDDTKLGLSRYGLHMPQVFENRVLRKIFGVRKEVKGDHKKLHNKKLHN
jgi:hypothetical protein